jgi:uncharacterized membrane protein YhaH (DUF805 family)
MNPSSHQQQLHGGNAMEFVTAIKTCFSKYATFQGRAGRAEYWWWFLFLVLVNLVLWQTRSNVITGIVGIALLLPNWAVSVRRLHDVNHSGWFLLLPAPFVALAAIFGTIYVLGRTGLMAPYAASGMAFATFGLISIAASLILLFWFCHKGTAGLNQYGAAPAMPLTNLSAQTMVII